MAVLVGAAPLGEGAGFMIPIFKQHARGNGEYVQIIGDNGLVSDLEIILPDPRLQPLPERRCDIGQPALWVFRDHSGEIHIGDRLELVRSTWAALRRRPIEAPLAMADLVLLCDLVDDHADILHAAYTSLARRSRSSAEIWRDSVVLLPAARRDILRGAANAGAARRQIREVCVVSHDNTCYIYGPEELQLPGEKFAIVRQRAKAFGIQKCLYRALASTERDNAPIAAPARRTQLQPMVPLLLELNGAEDLENEALAAALEEVVGEIEIRLGITLPSVTFRRSPNKGETRWELFAFDGPIGAGKLTPPSDLPALQEAVRQALKRNISLFIGIQEATNLLNRAGVDYPDTVKEVVRAMPIANVAVVLRRLAEEEVPLRNLRGILESLADGATRERSPVLLTELARVALRRQISHRYAPDGILRCIELDPELERHLRSAIRHDDGDPELVLDHDLRRRIVEAILTKTTETGATVILTAGDLRRHVRKLVEARAFSLGVLSFPELLPTLELDVAGHVALPG